jgi:hypothetical protein
MGGQLIRLQERCLLWLVLDRDGGVRPVRHGVCVWHTRGGSIASRGSGMRNRTSESLLRRRPRDELLEPRFTSCVRTPGHEKPRLGASQLPRLVDCAGPDPDCLDRATHGNYSSSCAQRWLNFASFHEPSKKMAAVTPSIDESALELPPGSGVDDEETIESADEIHDPFDPTLIRVERENPTIDLLVKRIRHDEINLSPDFQRKGGIWTDEAQSRLIESILIRIPLPAFYVDATDEDSWLVVDGLQRLTTLKRFIVDQSLALHGLEFLHQWEGKRFAELSRSLQRRIEEAGVTIFAIQKGTPEEVKFNIFKRINTGGLPLSSQEIRNALNGSRVRRFILKLVKSEEFKLATRNSIQDKRMADRECATRFLAFMLQEPSQYNRKDFDAFLNRVMSDLDNPTITTDSKLGELEEQFHAAMNRARLVFGQYAFRKFYGQQYRLMPINKAIFEIWSVSLARLSPEKAERLIEQKNQVLARFAQLMHDNKFAQDVSQGTGSPPRVHRRFFAVSQLIKEVLGENA